MNPLEMVMRHMITVLRRAARRTEALLRTCARKASPVVSVGPVTESKGLMQVMRPRTEDLRRRGLVHGPFDEIPETPVPVSREEFAAKYRPLLEIRYGRPGMRWFEFSAPDFRYESHGSARQTARHQQAPCSVCGNPGHAGVWHDQNEARIRSSHRPCSVCGAPDHAGIWHEGSPAQIPEAYERGVIESSVCRSESLGDCPECQHPHGAPENGVCGFLARVEGNPSERSVCRCGSTDVPEPEGEKLSPAQILEKLTDQAWVDRGQLSPRAFREAWGEAPVISFNAHRLWCPKQDHHFLNCPHWGSE